MADFPPSSPSVQVNTIPSYLYTQYNDDDNLQAFVNAYNGMAQTYVTWFANAGLPVYTQLSGSLLDWMAQGLYGITRPILSAPSSGGYGPLNTFLVNSIPLNSSKQGSGGGFYTADDDTFQRILTWHFYKADGKIFTLPWLKRRVLRFLYGANGMDIPFQVSDLSEDYTKLIVQGYIDPNITYTRNDSAKTYFNSSKILSTAGVNVWPDEFDPVTGAYKGKSVWQSSTNEVLNSAAPATQTVTLAAGTYCLWCIGTGSVVSAAGTAVGTGFGTSSGSTFSQGTIPAGGTNVITITTAGTVTLTVSGSLSYLQLEPGSFPTPYIATTTAPVTRNLDLASILASTLANSYTGATWIATLLTSSPPLNPSLIVGSSTGVQGLGITSTNFPSPVGEFNGSVSLVTVNTVSAATQAIVGWSYTSSSRNVCLNGGVVASDTGVSFSANPANFYLGINLEGLAINGNLPSVVYYPYAMTAAQLQFVTTYGFVPETFPDVANTSEISITVSGYNVTIDLSNITGVSTQILESFEYAINGKILELPPQFSYTVTL